jgi:hypothetical protein
MERSLAAIEKAHGSAATAAVQQQNALTNLEGKVSSVTGTIGKLTAVFGGLFLAYEAIKRGFEAFDSLEQHNIDLLRTTEILGGNAQAASLWSVAANEMGLSLDMIDKAFTKLSTDMNAAANPALKQMGINVEDVNGKLRPVNDVILQAADYFHQHAGAVNNAALANQLFGRSGYELLPILEQGRAGLAALTEEAKKYGLILDSTTIERNAALTFQLKEAQMAGEGLALSLENALLPGIAAIGQAFSKVVSDNLPAFIAGVNRAVSYIIGFVEGLTGMTMKVGEGAMALSNLGSVSGDTGTGLDKAASSSQALADAQQRVRDQAQEATRAIDAQVTALNAQMAATAFSDQQASLKQKSEDEQLNITKLSQDKQLALFLGNSVQAKQIDEQLTTAKEQNAQTTLQITRGIENESIKDKIASLELQKQKIQDAANDHIQAMQRAARGTTEAMGGAAATMAPLFSKAGQDAASKFKFAMDAGAEATGASMGQKLMDALFGPEVWVDTDRNIKGHFERQGGTDFMKIGQVIGETIGTGLTTALGKAFQKWWNDLGQRLFDPASVPGADTGPLPGTPGGPPSTLPWYAGFGSAEGGVFTQPTLTWVGEKPGNPEAIVPAAALQALTQAAAAPPTGLRPGNTAPGASPLPAIAAASLPGMPGSAIPTSLPAAPPASTGSGAMPPTVSSAPQAVSAPSSLPPIPPATVAAFSRGAGLSEGASVPAAFAAQPGTAAPASPQQPVSGYSILRLPEVNPAQPPSASSQPVPSLAQTSTIAPALPSSSPAPASLALPSSFAGAAVSQPVSVATSGASSSTIRVQVDQAAAAGPLSDPEIKALLKQIVQGQAAANRLLEAIGSYSPRGGLAATQGLA